MAVKYEFVFLTPPGTDKKKLETVFSDLESQIKSIDGKVKDKKKEGKKDLAYEIKSNSQADFWVWEIDFPQGPNFDALNTYLNRSDTVIRYLLLKKD